MVGGHSVGVVSLFGGSRSRLPLSFLNGEVLLSRSEAWTWVRLPLSPYEFLTSVARESLAQQVTLALANISNGTSDAVDVHLVVRDVPLDVDAWLGQLAGYVDQRSPKPVWREYAGGMAGHLDSMGFTTKVVYLGIRLGRRSSSGGQGLVGSVVGPVKKLVNEVAALGGGRDYVVDAEEIEFWGVKARDVRRSLGASHLKAVPASAGEVASLVMAPWWPEPLVMPEPSAVPSQPWGAGELTQLVEGSVTEHHRWLEVKQQGAGSGFSAYLTFSRFPDVLEFPAQEPWIHFVAALPFNVGFHSRMQIVPASKVRKDVGKKLADAKDQAMHIAEAGSAVPLAVREQLNVATELEYLIDKDRLPWLYGRHRLVVHGSSAEEVTGRAQTIIEAYRDLGIDVVWPTGDQLPLAVESCPGGAIAGSAYQQRQELAVIAGGMVTASAHVGDPAANRGSGLWQGPYIGYTTSRVCTPVFFSPHLAMASNRPPGVAIIGSPGAGKSFLAFTLAYQMAASGVSCIYLDPKADAVPMGDLQGLGEPRVFDLRNGADGMLDPFHMGETAAESRLLALETLRLLLGGHVSEEREEALLAAVEFVGSQSHPSLNKVVEYLTTNAASTGARNLGSVLRAIQDLPFARLCFSPFHTARLNPEHGLTIVTLLGLDLPTAETDPADYSYENRLATSVMYLLVRYARKLMLSLDKSAPKAILIDEAWVITATPQGARLLPEIARMGRSHNTAIVAISQNAGDLMEEAVTNSMSTKLAFRSEVAAEIDDVLTLLGIPLDQGYQSVIRNLNNGECVMQDAHGRTARVQIDAWDPALKAAFDTNPLTRGNQSN